MNYYMPFMPQAANTGLLSKIFKNGINWSSILTNTQKTLNIINQTIPVLKQAKPVINNAKTMFKIMNEFKKVDTPKKNSEPTNNVSAQNINSSIVDSKSISNNPVFFV